MLMKSLILRQSLTLGVSVAGLVYAAPDGAAQNSPAAPTATDTPASVTVGQPGLVPVSAGVADILKLAQAKIGDDTIVAFIESSKTSYKLSATEIISLRERGVSDRVLTSMLSQRQKLTPSNATTPPPASAPARNLNASAPQYAANYVPTAPTDGSTPTVYVMPNSSPAYAYPDYGYYPYAGGYYGYSYPWLSLGYGIGVGYGGWGCYGGGYYGRNCYRGGYYYGRGYGGNCYPGGGYRGAGYAVGASAGGYRGGAAYARPQSVAYRGAGNLSGGYRGGGGGGRHR